MKENAPPVLEQVKQKLADIAVREGLLNAKVTVLAIGLSPDEDVGEPGTRYFPSVDGKERMIEATVNGGRGQAFSVVRREFVGTLRDVLALPLDSNERRAVFIATLNAALRSLGLARRTIHCSEHEGRACSEELASLVWDRWGSVPIGLIGLQPAIANALVETFGPKNVLISDIEPARVKKMNLGVKALDERTETDELITASRVIILSSATLVHGTFDAIWKRIQEAKKFYMIYGVTGAGVCELMGLNRICPKGK